MGKGANQLNPLYQEIPPNCLCQKLQSEVMRSRAATLALLMIASILAGCTTSGEIENDEEDSRITDLEVSQQELAVKILEQERTNSDLLASISQIESANMQAIEALESEYLESIAELEASYLAAMDASAIANSQSLEEINATNAASYEGLLSTLNTLQTNLQNSEDSINQISLIVDSLEDVSASDGEMESQIDTLQQSLLSLQSGINASISDLEDRLNNSRAINDFSYLDFRGSELFNINNGLGWIIEPPIFDFANLANATLSYSNLSDASFINANLAGANGLFSTFHRTDFTRATMSQGIWRQSDFSNATFVQSNLGYTEFRWSDLSGANLSGVSAYGGSNWMGVDLSYSDLTNAMMWDMDLRGANLTGADLTGARLDYLNPSYGPADISGVTWDWAICPDGTSAYYHGQTCVNNL